MKTSKKKWLYRALCAAMVVALVSGTAVMTPIADIVGTSIVANAATYTGSVDIDDLSSGDLIKKGTEIYGDDMIQFIDANNTEPYPFCTSTSWITDQDFTVSSVSYYGSEYQLYLRAAATSTSTSAPKLAQGLIIHSGDTVDFANQWFMRDDAPGYKVWSCGEGVVTITYVGYGDSGQYCFNTSGNYDIYVTSPNIGTDVALKVNGGNGTEGMPFTFEVVPASSPSSTSYTVTWMDGTTLLSTSSVAEGESPVYDGETEKTVNGKEYCIKGWKDNNGTYYAKDKLPAATGDVVYTAVYALLIEVETEASEYFATNQKLKTYTGTHFQINCDNVGDGDGFVLYSRYDEDDGDEFARATIASLDGAVITKLALSKGAFDIESVYASHGTRTTDDYTATFSDVNATTVTAYSNSPEEVYIKSVKVYYKIKEKVEGYTVTWKDGETTLRETDVPTGKTPVYDGETTKTVNGKQYRIKGWTDSDGTFYAVGDTLPAVTDNVTYTAVYALLVEGENYIETFEPFDTNQELDSYTGTHFKITFDNAGDEDGIYIGDGRTAYVKSYDGTEITKLVATIGSGDANNILLREDLIYKTVSGNVATFAGVNTTEVELYVDGWNSVKVKHVDVYYKAKEKVEGYTVTWKDGETTLGETDVPTGKTPVYDGETTKTVNGKEYVLKGWKDNNGTYYAKDSLPAVTDYVTYTAVYAVLVEVESETETFEPFDTNQGKGLYDGNHFKIECDDAGDNNGFWLYHTIDTENFDEPTDISIEAVVESKDGTEITKLVVTKGSGDANDIFSTNSDGIIKGDLVTFNGIYDTSVGLYNGDLDGDTTVQIKHIDVYYKAKEKVEGYTVTWKDGETTLGEADVATGKSPVYDGETTKAGENGIKYVLSGWNDGTTTYAPNELPAVTGNVTYTAVYDTLYPFTVTTATDGATVTVTDNNSNTVDIVDGEFTGKVGYKVTSSVPLDFDGAKANFTYAENKLVYTITEISENTVAVTESEWLTAYTEEELYIAFSIGVKVRLGDDIENNSGFSVYRDTVLDTNGHTITIKGLGFYLLVGSGVTMTIKGDGAIKQSSIVTAAGAIFVAQGATLNIEGSTVTNASPDGKSVDAANGATVNITGGSYYPAPKDEYIADGSVVEFNETTGLYDVREDPHQFTFASDTNGATITVADRKGNAVDVVDSSFSGTVGYKITATIPLNFDGATATESVEDSNFIYTITEITADAVTVSNAQVDISDLTITAEDQTYTGSALTPVVVKYEKQALVENTDYTVTYENNTNAGTATAKITGKGKYKGETTVDFTINPQDISALAVAVDLDGDGTAYSETTYSAVAEKPSITYDGKKYTPTAKLLFSNEEVPTDSYDVSITPAQDADTYTITFTAKENTNFTGTRTFDWDITKADMTITMTDGLSFNRVGKNVALECVDENAFNVKGAPEGSVTTFTYFSESGLQLPKKPTEAGNYKVKAVVTNDNYNDGEATATFTIISNQAGDYYFSQTANNTILITGYAGDSTEVAIPETINGLPVTGIYYYAFEDSDITSITIPTSVDMIYSYAFKNAKDLTDVYYEGSKTEWNKEVTVSNGNNLLKNATIHYALPENIYLDQTSLETTVGKSVRLLVSVSPVGTPADFTWESSDETVATVDENGNVTTLDFGTATITATADNGKTAVCELTVGHNGNNGIFEYTVSDDKEITLTKYIGTSDTVDVTEKIDDMPVIAIDDGTFTETSVKTINYVGSKTMWEELFTGELAGDITVNYALPTSISLDDTADVTKADTITLTPTVTPADTATTFTWTSADETIATVDENGVVTGIAYGTVDITATADNGQTATCAVTVTNIGEKDGFEYEIVTTDDEDSITITKYNGSDEEVNIPETINGIPVTVIGAEAFKDNETMKDVIILLNVETIEEDAFAGCDSELNIHGYRRTDSERYATENDINFIAIPYPLENNSTISSTNVDVNKKVTVTGIGNEGTLSYKYAVYYKSTDSETWIARQSYNKNNVVTLTFTKDGTYDICVKVKDTAGSVEKKYFVLTVTQPLTNTSTISANVITLGESFTVDMSAQDGSGTYEYAVETKPISETEWTTVSDYSADKSVTITPDKAGVQNVCVNVKDSFGTIKKKYFVVDVKYTAPSNISTISVDTIKVGESVTVNCTAENGSGTFKYGVYTKSVESAKWTTVQNFEENSEVNVTFDKPGIYQVCAKAMDTDGTIVKKYFAVEVTKDALFNKSTISASEIMAGESIEVNAVSEGGFGAYKYAVYYKLSESSKWTTVQQFDANGNVTITPTKAGRYEICVKVKDETGEIVKKYFMAEVKYEPLVNKCTLSAEEVNFGETLTVTANAENGSGEYKYAVYIKSTERTAWNTVQDFSEQTEINVTFKNKGAYDICIKVMDSYGTVSKTYTSVYVK